MKVLFDTNVYVAQALLGEGAQRLIDATQKASWTVLTTSHIVDELERVLTHYFDCSRRFASLSRKRVLRGATVVDIRSSRHRVPDDSDDSPILTAALTGGADYLVTNDAHLLRLSPYEGLRIISMTDYHTLLVDHGLLSPDPRR